MKKAKSSEKELRSWHSVTFEDLPDNAALDPVEELGMVGAQQAADYLGIGTGKLRRMWIDNTADLVALGARAMTAKTATQGMDGVQLLGSGERSVALTSGERWVVPKLSHHYYTAPSLAYLQDKLASPKVALPAVVSPIPAAPAATALSQDVRIFDNPEFGRVRVVVFNDEPWLVGKDVAATLGYANPQKAIRDHVDKEDRTVNKSFTVNGTPIVLINESGLYSLVLSSKLERAKKFKRWVTSEVLPSIRKTGKYSVEAAAPTESVLPRDLPTALRMLADEIETTAALTAKIEKDRPKVEFATQISEYKGTISVGDFAKLLSKNGYMIGRNQLFEWMRGAKILDKNNVPYQIHMTAGRFEVIEAWKYGHPRRVVRITGKGQVWLQGLLAKNGKQFRK